MASISMITTLIFAITTIDVYGKFDYFVGDEMQDYSNVFGAVPDPNKSTDYVTYLGNYDSTDECISACVNKGTKDNKCYSWTYLTKNYYVDTYKLHCYGLFGRQYGSVWSIAPDSDAVTGGIISI